MFDLLTSDKSLQLRVDPAPTTQPVVQSMNENYELTTLLSWWGPSWLIPWMAGLAIASWVGVFGLAFVSTMRVRRRTALENCRKQRTLTIQERMMDNSQSEDSASEEIPAVENKPSLVPLAEIPRDSLASRCFCGEFFLINDYDAWLENHSTCSRQLPTQRVSSGAASE